MWKYPDEVNEFIADNVKGKRILELAELVNLKFGTEFTHSKMRSYLKNHGLTTGMPTKAKGEGSIYPEEIRKFIGKHYQGTGHQAMADLLNQTFGTDYTKEQIKGYYGRHKLDSGLTGRFVKGQESWNKGKPKSWVGGEETQFKAGHIPANYRPVGSERINVEEYTEIKVKDPNTWRLKHQVVWEEHNGKIPKGYAVIFGDGDKSNLDIGNLILVSRRQLAVLNRHGLIQKDADLTKVGVAIADVKMKISEKSKKGR